MSDWVENLKRMVPDPYDRNARLYPMLVLLFPGLLSFWSIVPGEMYNWEAIAGLACWCGLGFLLKELGRELGKRKEKSLWTSWGGPPSTLYLRHRGNTNKMTLNRVHKNLQTIIPDLKIPSLDFEKTEPDKADEVYEECTRVMRDKTRDEKKFPLVFKELCSYGFWRNLWGLRLWGLSLTFLCVVVIALAILLDWRANRCLGSYNTVICEIMNVAIFLFWLTLNGDRVRIPAFAYAERLFEATEQLAKTKEG